MPKISKHECLLKKSVQCALSAIEVYNKPDFKYREECFVILMTNSWELLLKAKILLDNKNNPRSIYLIDQNKSLTKKLKPRKKAVYKKNRCGNFMTIDIFKAIDKINKDNLNNPLDKTLRDNIEILVELRDNAVHFLNECPGLGKKIQEVGTANLKSFLIMVSEWFDFDLSRFNFYLMPLSFYHSFEMESFSINNKDTQIKNLLKYIKQKEILNQNENIESHNISLKLETKFVRSQNSDGINVKYSPNPDISVKLDSEKLFENKYPLRYKEELIPKLKDRYKNFKMDKDFYKLKKELELNPNYCGEKFLDNKRKNSPKKKFYNPDIFKEFDKHYQKSNLTLFEQ
jgi:hypothetical protein